MPNSLPQNQPSAPPNGLDPSVLNLAKAIRFTESQDNFNAKGGSGEYGAYQYTEPTWNATATKYGINKPLTQATPEEQNVVAYNTILDYKNQGLNPMQIASVWNSGKTDPNGLVGVNKYGVAYDTPTYVNKVYSKYNELKGGAAMVAQEQKKELPQYGAIFPFESGDSGLVAGLKALGNLPTSVYGFGEGIVNMAMHPMDTFEGVGRTVIGGVEKLQGKDGTENTQQFDAFTEYFKDRYGSIENAANAAVNDPFGVGTDIATILAGGEGALLRGAKGIDAVAGTKTAAGAQAGVDAFNNLGVRAAGGVLSPLGKTGDALANMGKLGSDKNVIDAAARMDVNLPASAMTRNPIVRSLDTLAMTGAGADVAQARVVKAIDRMDEIAQEIIAATNGEADLVAAGQKISEGLKKFDAQYRATNEKLYGKLDGDLGDFGAQTQTALQTLNKIIEDKVAVRDMTNLKYFEDLKDVLMGKGQGVKPPTFKTLRTLKTNLGQKIDSRFQDAFASQNIRQLKQMYGAVSQSIGDTIRATGNKDYMKLFSAANQNYISGMKVLKSQYGKTISRLAKEGQFDKIAESIIKPSTSIEDIPKILAYLGEEGANNVRSSLLTRILRDARNAEGELMPQGIARQVKKFGAEKIDKVLTPDQLQSLSDLATLTKALGDSQWMMKGSQTAFLLRTMAEMGTLGAGMYKLATGDVVGGVSFIGGVIGSEGASYFLASQAGQNLLKAFFVKGAELSAEGAKYGLGKDDTMGGNGRTSAPNSGVPNRPTGGTDIAVPRTDTGELAPVVKQADIQKLANEKGFDLEAARAEGIPEEDITLFLTGKTRRGGTTNPEFDARVTPPDEIVMNETPTNTLTARQKDIVASLTDENKKAYLEHKKATDAVFSEFQDKYDAVANGANLAEVDMPWAAARKSDPRAIEKGIDDYAGDFTQVKDMNRGAFTASSPENVVAIAEQIAKNFDIVKVNNRVSNPTSVGYRDVLINVKMSNGTIAELQISLPEMAKAKETMHAQYEIQRALEPEMLKRSLTQDELNKYNGALNKQLEVYSKAWDDTKAAMPDIEKSFVDVEKHLPKKQNNV